MSDGNNNQIYLCEIILLAMLLDRLEFGFCVEGDMLVTGDDFTHSCSSSCKNIFHQ